MAIEASPTLLNISRYRPDPRGEPTGEEDGGTHQGNALLLAMEIFDCTFDEVPHLEYANYLGNPHNHLVLSQFVGLLHPLPLSLLSVLYKLCENLYFIAEAQNIDRILEEVSKQWCHMYPDTIWKDNYKFCHIILFSLSILNAILHNDNAQSNSNDKFFTCDAFINNTFSALEPEFKKCNIDPLAIEKQVVSELSSYFEGLKHKPLPLSKGKIYFNKDENENDDDDDNLRFKLSKTNTNESALIYNDSDIRSLSSAQLHESILTNRSLPNNIELPSLYVKESFDDNFFLTNNSCWFVDCILQISQNSFNQLIDGITRNKKKKKDMTNETSNSNKNGKKRLSRLISSFCKMQTFKKRVPESNTNMEFIDQYTSWIKVKIRIFEGRLYIFKFLNDIDYEENDLQRMQCKNGVQFYILSLFECFAELIQDNIIMSGQNSTKNFQIRFPPDLHGKRLILLFKTNDVNRSYNVVNCSNFWSARLSPVPIAQFEIVSNEEYGWSRKILNDCTNSDNDRKPIKRWKPLLTLGNLYEFHDDEDDNATNVVNKQLFHEKLLELNHFVTKLDTLIDEHNNLKLSIIKRWQRTSQFDIVMDNWNDKYLYLHSQYDKRKVYYKVLHDASSRIVK